ncbi:MAG: FtsQ-type POTRA domain-containing protein [Proteobacteria bacterium]|nr:FtsQ-type POTRA domain-containing protein [Burkholderiales bacterium]
MLADAWDRPAVLNAVANTLYGVATVLGLYALFFLVIHLPVFPVKEVRVLGTLSHVTREQVEATVRRQLTGNFFTVDLPGARRAFERLPWVRRVEVRRVWPDRLHVVLDEHVALARWGDTGLVNTHGEVFSAASDEKLPVFIGPPDSAHEIARQYTVFRDELARVRLVPTQLVLSPRRAWEIRVSSGLVLKLGRDQVNARLATFMSVYEGTVAPVSSRLDYVDLRYPNGFAVRLSDGRTEGRTDARTEGRGVRPNPRAVDPKTTERRT